ncbi:MAG TPA: TetR family transcriptional regulator [Devosiaceae bacterium]|jgi:AcrR family transcriptional regulator
MAETLTAERIMETAEQVLRRFGPAKATVVDVARALGVSHGSVYRHFASKAELRDAVVERWLKRGSDPLAKFTTGPGRAPERLRQWFDALIASKREKVTADPEMFAVTREIFAESREVIGRHVETLVRQIKMILDDGVAEGSFAIADTQATASAIFDATSRYHDPAHAGDWADPQIDAAFDRLWTLITAGVTAAR